ncbi:MBL fold metallo-hydrolase [Flaviaesturariibacter amylovorans]|uniref:MBL fold metallo-hydrolase n=1 Tax=Flaviaesturariibacter amylovorans TaxID=1084520 RepID=A0ABP8G9S1_9BACT
MTIIPLSEGSFTIDRTKQFVPFDEQQHVLTDRPTGSILVEIQPFLVATGKDLLLLDCGLGYSIEGELQLHRNIEAAGFAPQQVTKVLMSHLHKDHAGGVAFGPNNAWLSLPNATYYVQQRELDYSLSPDNLSYIKDDLEALEGSHQVEFLKDDEGTIDGYIHYRHTGAHSKHHQVFWIREGNETIFFGGDDAPQLKQMKTRYKTKYDFNADLASELRQQWWEQGNNEGWTFLFYHDIATPTYKRP